MAHKWRIEAIRKYPDSSLDVDYIEIQPGPTMRSWLAQHKGEPLYLCVTHLPTKRCLAKRIRNEGGDTWRVDTKSEGLVTLERAATMMKADLEDAYEAEKTINERG